MKRLSLIFLCLIFGAALYPQDLTLAELNQRIRELERRIELLEEALQKQSMVPPGLETRVPSGREAWRQLRRGMDEAQVRRILGEPERVSGGAFTVWYYSPGQVTFLEDKLDSWEEPRR